MKNFSVKTRTRTRSLSLSRTEGTGTGLPGLAGPVAVPFPPLPLLTPHPAPLPSRCPGSLLVHRPPRSTCECGRVPWQDEQSCTATSTEESNESAETFWSKMAVRRSYSDRDSLDNHKSRQDEPPNSRLFIVHHKSITEDDFRKAFDKYGNIEEIWMLKDRATGDLKGNGINLLGGSNFSLMSFSSIFPSLT